MSLADLLLQGSSGLLVGSKINFTPTYFERVKLSEDRGFAGDTRYAGAPPDV